MASRISVTWSASNTPRRSLSECPPISRSTASLNDSSSRFLQPDVQTFVAKIDTAAGVSEADLETLDEVKGVTPLVETDDKTVYELHVELADTPFTSIDDGRSGVAKMKSTTITPDGWRETKVFKDHVTFNEFRMMMEENGVSLDLISIAPNSPESDDLHQDGLTERQREALSLAVSRGYYESPRQVTVEELAEELGISQPSLSPRSSVAVSANS
ncbi:hypothetical protein Hjap01_03794 [Haloarcula japonica]